MMLLFIAPPELRRIVAFAPSVISTLMDPAVASEELSGVMSNTAPAPTEMEGRLGGGQRAALNGYLAGERVRARERQLAGTLLHETRRTGNHA